MIVAFEDLELDLSQVELRRSGVRVPVEPQVFEVLAYLVNHRDRVVPKEELMDNVWGGRLIRRDGGHQPDQAGPPGDRR